MDSSIILVYVSSLVALFGIIRYVFRNMWNQAEYSCFLLFGSSILYALFSAQIAYSLEYDAKMYLADAILLKSYLVKDSSYWGLLFLTGGNSLYPPSFYPMLVASNTWSQYSTFTFEKYFLVFSQISKFNLYTISVFFGAISFVAKLLLLQTMKIRHVEDVRIKIMYSILLIGGLDVYFISGLYKETLLFFFIVYLVYYSVSKKSIFKTFFFVFCFSQLVLLKVEIAILLGVLLGLFYLWRLIQIKKYGYAFLLMIMMLSTSVLFFQQILGYVVNRVHRFQMKQIGDTAKELWITQNGWVDTIFSCIQSFFSVFYTPMDSGHTLFIVVNGYNRILVLFLLVLFFKLKWRMNAFYYFILFFVFINILAIGSVVPNYGAQLRYRAPFILFLITILIYNYRISKKNI